MAPLHFVLKIQSESGAYQIRLFLGTTGNVFRLKSENSCSVVFKVAVYVEKVTVFGAFIAKQSSGIFGVERSRDSLFEYIRLIQCKRVVRFVLSQYGDERIVLAPSAHQV